MSESFLNGRVILHPGDCLDVLARLEECSVDSCVTDPPYHLTSIVKRFGSDTAAPAQFGTDGRYARASAGFMGKQWDGGDIAFRPDVWRQVYRVLKPGAHLLAFGGTRTYHRMACAIEDAGFEIRDCIQWLYGSGFPKSHDVSKGIDRAAGVVREVVGSKLGQPGYAYTETTGRMLPGQLNGAAKGYLDITAPATDAARQWSGWGTALKPACEPIVLARKPLSESTVAANVLKWGTGAINVDGCRIAGDMGPDRALSKPRRNDNRIFGTANTTINPQSPFGRWPANVIHDGSEEVVGAFPDVHGAGSAQGKQDKWADQEQKEGWGNIGLGPNGARFGDSGSAARFFYQAKADTDDRLGSKHPTVKPLDLMQYLVRLVTPPKGVVLDPFAGTGTTGQAAFCEGMSAILIEREAEYQDCIRRRMALVLAGPDEKQIAIIKAKGLTESPGPLFEALT